MHYGCRRKSQFVSHLLITCNSIRAIGDNQLLKQRVRQFLLPNGYEVQSISKSSVLFMSFDLLFDLSLKGVSGFKVLRFCSSQALDSRLQAKTLTFGCNCIRNLKILKKKLKLKTPLNTGHKFIRELKKKRGEENRKHCACIKWASQNANTKRLLTMSSGTHLSLYKVI